MTTPSRPIEPAAEDQGGDPACWLARVCPECGRLADREPPVVCEACGTHFGDEDD